ncbi:hypothetical protein F4777DRAFT_540720 [Nemania sp. FL0916]|nr:hypothetical protein F4777DRAFT_540720 [Nemania sp. FL0916]
MDSSLVSPYSLSDITERRYHIRIVPALTARLGNGSSDNGDGGLSIIFSNSFRIKASHYRDGDTINTKRKNKETQKLSNDPESIDSPVGVTSCRDPSVDPDSGSEVKTEGHDNGIAVFDCLGAASLAPAAIHSSPSQATTVPLALGSTPSYHHCATQRRASGIARAQVGLGGYIPRWVRGATIPYIVIERSFRGRGHARFAAAMAARAIAMWQGIGVTFEQVSRNSLATFDIRYRDLPFNEKPDVYAEAFFPQEGRGTLYVYQLAMLEPNRGCLDGILAHEIGHILGLRHEFAGEPGSVLWGKRNVNSVMNYFSDVRQYSVQNQDLMELRSFYEFTGKQYKGLEIRDFMPGKFSFEVKRKGRKKGAVR